MKNHIKENPLTLRFDYDSHPGINRYQNNDSVLVSNKHKLMAIADGIGRQISAHTASKRCLDYILEHIKQNSYSNKTSKNKPQLTANSNTKRQPEFI